MLEVIITNDRATEAKLDAFEEHLHREIYAALLECGLRLETTAREEAPKRTANLARSIDTDIRRYPSRWDLALSFGRGAPYARHVVEGTGVFHAPDSHTPWVVRPRPGRVGRGGRPATLRFTWQGAVWYRRQVTIRGARANDFPHRALRRESAFIRRRFAEIGPRMKAWL